MQILSSQIRPEPAIKPHHVRHFISGSIVFALGIAADLVIMEWRHYSPKTIRWQNGGVESGYRLRQQALPPASGSNVNVELGLANDGTLVWRTTK